MQNIHAKNRIKNLEAECQKHFNAARELYALARHNANAFGAIREEQKLLSGVALLGMAFLSSIAVLFVILREVSR